jgi:serine/threonine protein kinase
MFELLTNKLPYTGVNPDDLLNKHLRGVVPTIQVHNSYVTPELGDLVRRMMSKSPEQRPASMGDVLKEFRSLRPFKMGSKLSQAAAEIDSGTQT